MYTTIILGKTIDRAKQIVIVTVQFASGEKQFVKDFQFNLGTEYEVMKKTVKQYIEKLESAEAEQTKITEGEIDLSSVDTTVPIETKTPAQIDAEIFLEKYLEFEQIQRMVDLGIVPAGTKFIENKRTALANSVKPSYAEMIAKHKDNLKM